VRDDRRLEERAAERVPLAAEHDLRALGHGIGDVLLDLGHRLRVDQRALLGRALQAVADAQLATASASLLANAS
jgi:hypothetical protein